MVRDGCGCWQGADIPGAEGGGACKPQDYCWHLGCILPRVHQSSCGQATTNCNFAVDYGKALGCQLVNIGGSDIVAGNRKLILGLSWQLMRM